MSCKKRDKFAHRFAHRLIYSLHVFKCISTLVFSCISCAFSRVFSDLYIQEFIVIIKNGDFAGLKHAFKRTFYKCKPFLRSKFQCVGMKA